MQSHNCTLRGNNAFELNNSINHSKITVCEEYQELTPFLGFVHVWLMQESHIFKWADKKWHTKFSGFVGDTKADIMT